MKRTFTLVLALVVVLLASCTEEPLTPPGLLTTPA